MFQDGPIYCINIDKCLEAIDDKRVRFRDCKFTEEQRWTFAEYPPIYNQMIRGEGGFTEQFKKLGEFCMKYGLPAPPLVTQPTTQKPKLSTKTRS